MSYTVEGCGLDAVFVCVFLCVCVCVCGVGGVCSGGLNNEVIENHPNGSVSSG